MHGKKLRMYPWREKYAWDGGVTMIGLGLSLVVTEVWPQVYWVGVVLVYLGLLALLWHFAGDKDLREKVSPTRRRGFLVLFVLVWVLLVYGWSAKVVFAPAALRTDSYANLGNYVSGTSLGGMNWDSSRDIDLRVDLENDSGVDYRDIDISLSADLTFIAGSQITDIPGVNFFRENPRTPIGAAWLEDDTGNSVPLPAESLDMSQPRGYRVVCDKFPKHSAIKLIFKLWALNYSTGSLPQEMLSPKRLPRWVEIKGDYRALGRTRRIEIHQNIEHHGQRRLPSAVIN